jgi:FkbM family methyltransferase
VLHLLFLDKKYIAYTYSLRKSLARFLFSLKPFVVEVDGARFMVNPRSADLFTIYEIFHDRGYLPKLKNAPSRVEIVADFGANMGVFSIWAAQVFHPRAVYAVEMESRCFDRLVTNIDLNQLRATIQPVQAAIYSQTGRVGARRIPGSDFYAIRPGGRGYSLPAISFRDFFDSTGIGTIDLLKIDIEGAEKYLLTDENKHLFKERVRYVMLETHSLNDFRVEQDLRYFTELGYQLEMTPTPYIIDKNFIIDAWNPSI